VLARNRHAADHQRHHSRTARHSHD
jgi:hypothetical protein